MLRDYLEILLLLAVVCTAVIYSPGNMAQAAPAIERGNSIQARKNAIATPACDPGETPFWIDAAVMECLKEQR